jgi:hypothetical protein
MAVYHHANRTIAYQMEFAPFQHDLLLLQSSRFTTDFWRPVLENLGQHTPSSGRVVACDWFDKNLSEQELAKDLDQLIKTIGLTSVHVVACDDAVDLVGELEKLSPGRFENTLLYPQSVPRPEQLSRSIRAFSQI